MTEAARCRCGGLFANGRCGTCFREGCDECAGPLNHRGRCTDYQCRRFGLLPDQEPRQREEEAAEVRAWTEYYRTVGTVRHQGP